MNISDLSYVTPATKEVKGGHWTPQQQERFAKIEQFEPPSKTVILKAIESIDKSIPQEQMPIPKEFLRTSGGFVNATF